MKNRRKGENRHEYRYNGHYGGAGDRYPARLDAGLAKMGVAGGGPSRLRVVAEDSKQKNHRYERCQSYHPSIRVSNPHLMRADYHWKISLPTTVFQGCTLLDEG
jgi:hypothetical protein